MDFGVELKLAKYEIIEDGYWIIKNHVYDVLSVKSSKITDEKVSGGLCNVSLAEVTLSSTVKPQ